MGLTADSVVRSRGSNEFHKGGLRAHLLGHQNGGPFHHCRLRSTTPHFPWRFQAHQARFGRIPSNPEFGEVGKSLDFFLSFSFGSSRKLLYIFFDVPFSSRSRRWRRGLILFEVKAIENLWGELSAQHFANVLWTLGKTRGQMPLEFWKTTAKKGPPLKSAQDCAHVACTYKRVNFQEEEAFDGLAICTDRVANDLTPQGIANIAWAFNGYQGVHKEQLTQCLVAQCLKVPREQWATKTLAILGRQLPTAEIRALLCHDFLERSGSYTPRDVVEV